MEKLKQLLSKLELNEENGLFYIDKYDQWLHLFPYRVSRVLKDILKPQAFYCLLKDSKKLDEENHPGPVNQQLILFYENIDKDTEEELHKKIINFGLAQAVFIIRENVIDIYYGGIEELAEAKILKKIKSGSYTDFDDFSFISQLTGKTWDKYVFTGQKIDRFLLQNITDARRILVAQDGYRLESKIANRLIGRLLFINYLIDRNVQFSDQDIIRGETKEDRRNSFHNIIKEKIKLYAFFKYLAKKYNGDMFPLTDSAGNQAASREESIVSKEHLTVLFHLFTCSSLFKTGGPLKGYTVQPSLFYLYDFEIIPVELISNIYENFIGNKEENEELKLEEANKQKDLKAYYTPPYLVDFMLSQTVEKHLAKNNHSSCKVLDPACGSGIFLVESLRKIIEKEISLKNNGNLKAELNDRTLWKLIKSNIFGIDIDEEAIDIAIFSIYVTILDYKKTPKEIENFRFENLKGTNFFGGQEADFFNEEHRFNEILGENELDFIIGNPPWGEVKKSIYNDYIKNRKKREVQNTPNTSNGKKSMPAIQLEIGDKEIAQAFLVRISDFCRPTYPTKCAFIVSSKVFYNGHETSKNFRKYFLSKFRIQTVIELALVNNKIVGGDKHIFDHARQPATIIIYEPNYSSTTWSNTVKHISIKPNRFFRQTKTIVIEKNDIKLIKQKFFIEEAGGFDWLWKVLVHGNVLDVFFIKRLREEYPTIDTVFGEAGIENNGGLKVKDGEKNYSTEKYFDYPYLDAKRGFKQFEISKEYKWKNEVLKLQMAGKIDEKGNVGYLPEDKYFQGYKLLVKKGLELPSFKGVSAISTEPILFSSTVCSYSPTKDDDKSKMLLNKACGLINSVLFPYYILQTSTSAGIERSRVHFSEISSVPFIDENTVNTIVEKINDTGKVKLIEQINDIILSKFSKQENALIRYASEVALPILFRDYLDPMFQPMHSISPKDKEYLSKYLNVFFEGFKNKFNYKGKKLASSVSITDLFIKVEFSVTETYNENSIEYIQNTPHQYINIIGGTGFYEVCRNIFLQHDIRGYTKNSFFILKPNERKCWHEAMAYSDVNEINNEITKAELKVFKFNAAK